MYNIHFDGVTIGHQYSVKLLYDKDIKVFSEGFELYIHNSSIIEGKNDQLKDSTA
jgi:hypothetical protein